MAQTRDPITGHLFDDGAARVRSGGNGEFNIYTLLADDAAAGSDTAVYRIDDATGFTDFRINVIDAVNANTTNLAFAWSTTAGAYSALAIELSAVLIDAATPDGTAHSNARIIEFVGDGTATKAFKDQPWISWDGTTRIKTIAVMVTGTGTQDIQVDTLS